MFFDAMVQKRGKMKKQTQTNFIQCAWDTNMNQRTNMIFHRLQRY